MSLMVTVDLLKVESDQSTSYSSNLGFFFLMERVLI